jgi:hypothetical protein
MRKIKSYFLLQLRLFNRKLRDAGIHPLVVYLFGIFGLVFLANAFFSSFAYASYAFVVFSLGMIAPLSNVTRNEFLLIVYGAQIKKLIRLFENTVLCIPFALVLIFFNAYQEAIVLLLAGSAMALFSYKINTHFSFPVPFAAGVFEYIIGFRKTFPVFILTLILTLIAILENNMNLGLFSMGLIIFTVMGYYFKPENEYLIWIFPESPNGFLWRKTNLAIKNLFLLLFPLTFLLLCFYPSEYQLLLTFLLVGGCLLSAIIMIKYASFPQEMNIPEYILLSLCVYFPPLVIGVMPFFYLRAKQNLKSLLDDKD